jgi:hypothetical protein
MVLSVELSNELITSINIYKALSGEIKYKKSKPIFKKQRQKEKKEFR